MHTGMVIRTVRWPLGLEVRGEWVVRGQWQIVVGFRSQVTTVEPVILINVINENDGCLDQGGTRGGLRSWILEGSNLGLRLGRDTFGST